jgi:hypothetical protein
MARAFVNLNDDAIVQSRSVSKEVDAVARSIQMTANRNVRNAKIGIVRRRQEDGITVRITARGAAAAPLEVGTRYVSARRPVKRALDAHEVR